ncbi:DEAD/DEAH box helicase [uncultured Parabacteroides sp.]|jgi:SWI/SNF-related matrix-associated actin-dependent regulator 1 of chromatin subfamily A|uniref:DEAD/DEAH box helicase n=1 Tax=uncultured Parabacteroides sp. TaxID=512312 RepID=UPI0025860E3D|nr:DEAD/DEAH box helicase [uncultured Parabacteroides sp.]
MLIQEDEKNYFLQFKYHPLMVDVVKRIPGRKFDSKLNMWVIPKSFYPPGKYTQKAYVDIFANWAVKYGYEKSVQKGAQASRPDVHYTLPPMPELLSPHGLKIEPFPYQKQGIAYALQKKRCFFGDQPGLGKTLQAIGTSFIAKTWPVLVICPASLKINWQREWKKFTGKDAIILDDRNKNNWYRYYEMGCCDVFITNYESLKKFFVEDFAGGVTRSIKLKPVANLFKCIIIDESHRCKSSKTQQSKICYKLCQGKEYRFLLTGTPSINGPGDLIQQLKIMNRLDDFGGYKSFEANFMGGPRQASNLEMLNWRLWNTCFFRREKAKVLDQLPDKMRQVVNVDITNRKEYQDAEHDLIGYLAAYENADDEKLRRAERGKVMVQMQKLRQIAARGKISAAVEFIQDIIDSGEKLIVFAFLKEVVQEIKKVFPNAVTIVGDNTSQERQDAVDRFQNDPKCQLIICNYKSAGVGLTLTASSRVAFVEFPWTFADCEQAEDRAHRIGQKNSVNCYYFLGKNTIDEDIWNLIQTKKDIANDVTGTDDQVPEKTVDAMILKMSAKSGIKKSETSTSPFNRRPEGALFSNAI